jgi:hypothetical protein
MENEIENLNEIISKLDINKKPSDNRINKLWDLIRRNKKTIINSNNIINNKFLAIIEILNNNVDIMLKCYFEIVCISKKYPPQKNENKFIYGKLTEIALFAAFSKIGIKCTDLDEQHSVGSEYKNDLKMFNIDISIKAKLNKKGNIILINKKSTDNHIIRIETLVCVIEEGKLYFIPSNIVDNELYVTRDAGTISYKSSLITMINKSYKQYIYSFPELTEEYKNKLNDIKEIDIYRKLYNESIRLN